MRYWLFKSEPSCWSWQQQVQAGAGGTAWSGVRNHLAKQNMMAMKSGDRGFFYHSNVGKEIVGIVEVIRDYYPDPTDATARFVMVDVKAVAPLPRPVTLAQVKATPALAKMSLVTSMRLSVQPVTAAEWTLICRMGGYCYKEAAPLPH
ncbi:MAG: EVE domain-containing protein [Alphaproteobacteria bacterium]|nr:EVE domain-containing protein [Alphaproteobacteria bacterium]